MVNAAHQVGGSLGLSVMVALTSGYTQMVLSFKWSMIIGLIINLFGIILALMVKQNSNRMEEE